jgi:hypothetical protein
VSQDNSRIAVSTEIRAGEWFVVVYVGGSRTELGPFDRKTAMLIENEQRSKVGLARRPD